MSKKKKKKYYKEKFQNEPWKLPSSPKNNKEILDRINTVKSFLNSTVKCLSQKEDGTAYILMDRSQMLCKQIMTAMEDLPPEGSENIV